MSPREPTGRVHAQRAERLQAHAQDDGARLGDRRLGARVRLLGLPAGADRRRADPGRFRGGALLGRGSARCCSTARSRPTRRCGLLGALLCGALVAVAVEGFAHGLRATLVRGSGRAVPRRRRRRGAARRAGARAGLGVRRRRAARARGRASCAPTSSARRSSSASTTSCRPRARCSTCSTGSTRRPRSRAPRRGWRRPTPRSPATPTCARRAPRSCACSAPPAGSASRARAGSPSPGLVVTNAHVVAGEDDTTVTTRAATELDATAVHYEPAQRPRDAAVSGLDAAPLPLAPTQQKGTAGAVLGYPENGPFTITPARLGETGEVDERGLLRPRPDRRA